MPLTCVSSQALAIISEGLGRLSRWCGLWVSARCRCWQQTAQWPAVWLHHLQLCHGPWYSLFCLGCCLQLIAYWLTRPPKNWNPHNLYFSILLCTQQIECGVPKLNIFSSHSVNTSCLESCNLIPPLSHLRRARLPLSYVSIVVTRHTNLYITGSHPDCAIVWSKCTVCCIINIERSDDSAQCCVRGWFYHHMHRFNSLYAEISLTESHISTVQVNHIPNMSWHDLEQRSGIG